MEAVISKNKQGACLLVNSVVVGTSIDLQFPTETESQAAYKKLKDLEVACYHAGCNAPNGPYISIYPSENKNLKLAIR
ncbi:hypothetical protein [Bacteroides sp. 224]|uniref:hypothetical protein n=1 Tax=Bacteroides sp. 224 TaxID=2302936 RepID=UPI0013D0B8EB|nr:hypothetical protein [Bacteroides sp. 224]NDV63988.1 hypothetical protein [Bacteroides sp. 224]